MSVWTICALRPYECWCTVAASWARSSITQPPCSTDAKTCPCVLSPYGVPAGCCRRPHQTLQRYEKTDSHMLVCTDCPQPPLVRNSRSQEHCARKCKKVKKNFSCRWVTIAFCFPEAPNTATPPLPLSSCVFTYFCCSSFCSSPLLPVCLYRAFNFQRHNRKCHLLPFDRFTHGVQKQANVNFTLYEKKGTVHYFQRRSLLTMLTLWTRLLFSRERSGAKRDFSRADCLLMIAGRASFASGPWFFFFFLLTR